MMWEAELTTIDLLRHGQCQGGEIFRGSTDVQLTELGWSQMHAAIAEESGWDLLLSSSMHRCREFAEQLSTEHALPLESFDAFREIHFGDWEGRSQQEVQASAGEHMQKFWDDPVNATPPNGESILDFKQRVVDCFSDICLQQQGKRMLFVVHGAVIRILMCELLQLPLTSLSRVSVPYASLTRFKIYHAQGRELWVQMCFHRGE